MTLNYNELHLALFSFQKSRSTKSTLKYLYLFIYLFIYLKALPSMVGQPQQLEANYSGPNNIT